MVRPKSNNPKPRFNRVRSMSSLLLGGGGSGGSSNAGTKLKKENRKVSQPVVIQSSVQHGTCVKNTKGSIIGSQRDIITCLEASTRLEKDLKASEKGIESLKKALEDFASVVATHRDEAKIAIRQRHTLKAVNARSKEEHETADLRRAVAVFNLQHQAAAYEREMRVLVSQLAAARDEVAEQYSEIFAINEDIAVINSNNRKLVVEHGELSIKNARLHQQLFNLHDDIPNPSPITSPRSVHST